MRFKISHSSSFHSWLSFIVAEIQKFQYTYEELAAFHCVTVKYRIEVFRNGPLDFHCASDVLSISISMTNETCVSCTVML
jgi:hypothetical protein